MRDATTARGRAHPDSAVKRRLLTVDVDTTPLPRPLGESASPWGGMSGAAVVNAADSDAVLAKCILRTSAERGQRAAFQAIADGFTTWYHSTGGTGVHVSFATWTHGELTVTLRDVFGLRLHSGRLLAVLPYVGGHELRQTDADVMLRIIEQSIDQILPEAQPAVLDTRRSKKFTLHSRKNRKDLDDAIAGEVARYVTHWQAAAA